MGKGVGVKTFQHLHMTRDYQLSLPERPAGRPLLLVLHGCTQNPDDIALGTGFNQRARERGWAVAYPHQTTQHNAKACWNWFHKEHQHPDRGEPALLAALAQSIVEEFQLDRNRVYLCGMSAGAAMGAILALHFPQLFRAAGLHSGLAPGAAASTLGALAAMKALSKPTPGPRIGIPTILFQGQKDSVVHFRNGQRLLDRLDLAGTRCEETHTHQKGQHSYTRWRYLTPEGEARAEYWLIHELDHAWSGGNPLGSYCDPKGPDASQAMLEFFQQFR